MIRCQNYSYTHPCRTTPRECCAFISYPHPCRTTLRESRFVRFISYPHPCRTTPRECCAFISYTHPCSSTLRECCAFQTNSLVLIREDIKKTHSILSGFTVSLQSDSNQRPAHYKCAALAN
jgi:proteasome lid subunit RPN8/RPN11